MSWKKLDNLQNFINYKATAAFLYTGEVTGFTSSTITDSTANWIVDEFKNKVVKVCYNAINFYAVVESNTNDTLICDDVLEMDPIVGNTICIVDTIDMNDYQLDTLIALDTRDNEVAILLQPSTIQNERRYIHAYIEQFADNNFAIVMCRGTDRQAGIKYGLLEDKIEGVRIHAHMWFVPHWDIIQTYNIKRFVFSVFSQDELITTNNYLAVGQYLLKSSGKRFYEKTIDNVNRYVYTSLLEVDFEITFTGGIFKTGSSGEASLTFAIYRNATSTIEILSDVEQTTLFGGGEGLLSISVKAYAKLKKNDYVFLVAKKTAGIMSITLGSNLSINEV